MKNVARAANQKRTQFLIEGSLSSLNRRYKLKSNRVMDNLIAVRWIEPEICIGEIAKSKAARRAILEFVILFPTK